MKRLIRLVTVLVVISLPRIGYSGDNRYDELLPLTASLLSQMFRSFVEEKFPEHLLNLEKLQVWSFNRDHYTSDGEPDEQTVDGVMVVTAGFQTAMSNTAMSNTAMLNTVDSASQLQPLNVVTQGIINAYFSSVLPLLTEYFRAHFNPDKNYYLDRANIEHDQLSAVADDSDDSDGSCDEDSGAVASAGAGATHQKCGSYACSGKGCEPVPEPAEFWKAHLISEGEQDFIVYEATLYYSGFLKPACTAEPREEPSPEQSDRAEEPSEEEILITQTRECIDLHDGGLDRGLSKHLRP